MKVARVSVVLIVIALIAGMAGCAPVEHDLTITSTAGGLVTTPGEGTFTYYEGTMVNLMAIPDAGYRFVNWTGDVATMTDIYAASTNITINADCSIIAGFEEIQEYSLTIASTVGGLVTSPGEGAFTYEEGTVVNLVATPDAGCLFVEWSGDVDTVGNINSASTTVTMSGNYSITAEFRQMPPEQFTLTISRTAGGLVTVPGEGTFEYEAGTVVSLVATPLNGYYFLNWTGDVGTVANVNAASTAITMTDNYSIKANLEKTVVTYYTLTLSVNGNGSTSPSVGKHTYIAGTVVSITATSGTCCGFINWTGNVSTVGNVNAASTTITMNDNYSITANFEEDVVTFPDPNLEAAIRGAIGKPTGPIYPSDLEGFTYFSGGANMNIADLSGLGCCTNLEYLYLYSNQISDISPLTNLVNLVYLHLGWNQISDISALGNLINLYGLHLEGNQIDDVSPLADLTNLTVLDLDGNSWISDISPLSSLTNLTSLSLDGNRISDISPLANLTNLTTLHLCFNQISDISPLSSLANLEELTLGVNEISTISALGSLTNLSYLYFGDNQISDISPLSTLTSLSYLQANANQISDISSLSSLINLTSLHLGSNQISGFSALSSLTNLTSLDLQQNQICDISPLNSLTNLENLHLGNNEISDISPLSSLANLRYLYLLGNYLGDISPLVENTGLGPADYVNLQYNYLDLTPGSEAMNDIQDLLGRGVVVYYEPQSKYALVVSSTTGGAVTLPGEGIFACDPGTVVSLAATPLSNCYQFGYWTGDVGAIANVNAPSTTITMNDNYSITAYFPRVVDLANTELHEAATAIICCLADAGTDLLTSPSGNATAVWRGELAVIYACGAGNVTYDAADYIYGPFRATYTVNGYGQILNGTCTAFGQWGNCIVWDADYMCWIETP